ncbi:CD2 antigen cytoplasmic tail-binding protein 2 [Patagioenas fasciata]|uniref:CD2 antigen cytoplasmic tail-binding protein 2 n=1 Tax=Patagioenas fasciata TaxID=372321 RepID=UPI003A998417
MAKRKVTIAEPPGGEGPEEPPRKRAPIGSIGGPGSHFPGQPSLDSDEEEEEEEEEEGAGAELLRGLGQEAGPAQGGEGPVPLTPFNLEEELGEGRFDPHGHFLPHRDPRPPDPWLEAIDWRQIKPRPPSPPRPPGDDIDPAPPSPPPLPQLLREVLGLLRPGETVGGALRRLAGPGHAPRGRGQNRGRGQARGRGAAAEGRGQRDGRGDAEGRGQRDGRSDVEGRGQGDGRGEAEGRGDAEGRGQRDGRGEAGGSGEDNEGRGQAEGVGQEGAGGGRSQAEGRGQAEGGGDEVGGRGQPGDGRGQREGSGDVEGRGQQGDGRGQVEGRGQAEGSGDEAEGRGHPADGRSKAEEEPGGGRGEGRSRGLGPAPLEALVALSDALVARGLFGVLQESRERLGARLRALGGASLSPAHSPAHQEPGHAPPEPGPALDMFADEEEGEGGAGPLSEVLWEFQWEHGGDPEIYGPFSSAQMQEWAAQGYFRGGARCRRVGPQGPFYDCSRVDFQLYT